MRKTIIAAAVAVGLLAAGALPATAGLGDVEQSFIDAEWVALDTDDGTGAPYPGTWAPGLADASENSHFVTATSANLVIPEENAPNLGTSIEIENLDLTADDTFSVAVAYSLHDGAVAGGGAPRLFVEVDGTYHHVIGEVGADSDSLVLWHLPAGTIGHVGVVYDNGAPGRVALQVFRIFDADHDITLNYPVGDSGSAGGPPHGGGQSVAEFVKSNGGPPPHANGRK